MKIFTKDNIAEVIEILKKGEIVALPTETVYGLAADASNDQAVQKIFLAKGRPSFNPLIIHAANKEIVKQHVEWNDLAETLAQAFWPGPLTIICPRRSESISKYATADLKTVGFRVPNHPLMLEVLEGLGGLIAAPSANVSGKLSCTTAQDVFLSFDQKIPVLDGGPSYCGLESTIVDCSGEIPVILRWGGVSIESLMKVCPEIIAETEAQQEGEVKSPGQLLAHYAPRKEIVMNVIDPLPTDAFLDFGSQVDPSTVMYYKDLSTKGSLKEAGANFFRFLHELDNTSANRIAVAPIPFRSIGISINDRLRRACANNFY